MRGRMDDTTRRTKMCRGTTAGAAAERREEVLGASTRELDDVFGEPGAAARARGSAPRDDIHLRSPLRADEIELCLCPSGYSCPLCSTLVPEPCYPSCPSSPLVSSRGAVRCSLSVLLLSPHSARERGTATAERLDIYWASVRNVVHCGADPWLFKGSE